MSKISYAEILHLGFEKLREAGVKNARQEARKLLLLASNLTSVDLISQEMHAADPGHCEAFNSLISQRAERKPFVHLEGWVSFYGLKLRSDQRALIPRPDSETLVDLALSVVNDDKEQTIADLGTGSGALLCALLSQCETAKGIAVEASDAALSLAKENFDLCGVLEQVEMVHGSWSDWQSWGACDVIISNPPYIAEPVIETLEPEVRDHEPLQALVGGRDGLDAYREIIALGAQYMRTGACLALEIGYDQCRAVDTLLQDAGFQDLEHRRDLNGHDRAILAKKS